MGCWATSRLVYTERLTPPFSSRIDSLSQAASLRSTKAVSGSRAAFAAKPLVRACLTDLTPPALQT